MPRGRTRYARPSGGTASGLWEAGSRLLTRCSRCRRIFSTPQRSSQPRAGLLPCDPIRPLRPLSALNSPLTWPTLGPRWGYAGGSLDRLLDRCSSPTWRASPRCAGWTLTYRRARPFPRLSQARRPSPVCPSLGDSNSTRTESCVAIRPDPEPQARSTPGKGTHRNGYRQIPHPSGDTEEGLKIPK